LVILFKFQNLSEFFFLILSLKGIFSIISFSRIFPSSLKLNKKNPEAKALGKFIKKILFGILFDEFYNSLDNEFLLCSEYDWGKIFLNLKNY